MKHRNFKIYFLKILFLILSFFFGAEFSTTFGSDSTQVLFDNISSVLEKDDSFRFLMQMDAASSIDPFGDKWADDAMEFNRKFNLYSIIFKKLDYDIIFSDSIKNINENISICDLEGDTTQLDYDFHNIYFVSSGCYSAFSSNKDAIIIDSSTADEIIKQSNSYTDYNSLFGYAISLSFDGDPATFYVEGVYKDQIDESYNYSHFSNFYNKNFGTTFFIDRRKNETLTATTSTDQTLINSKHFTRGNIYFSLGSQYVENLNVINYINAVLSSQNNSFLVPDLPINQIVFQNTCVLKLHQRIEENKTTSTYIVFTVFLFLFFVVFLVLYFRLFLKQNYMVQSDSLIKAFLFYVVFSNFSFLLIFCVFYYRFLLSLPINGILYPPTGTSSLTFGFIFFFLVLLIDMILLWKKLIFDKSKKLVFNDYVNLSSKFGMSCETTLQSESKCVFEPTERNENVFIKNEDKPTVLLFVRSYVPNSASLQRVFSLYKLCELSDLYPIIVTSPILDKTNTIDESFRIDFFDFCIFCSFFSKFCMIFGGFGVKKTLKKYLSTGHLSKIIFYSVLPPLTVLITKKFAKKNHISLFFDVVEFQDFWSQTIKTFFLFYLPNVFINRIAITKKDNVFSISQFSNSYFRKKGISSTILPFLCSNVSYSFSSVIPHSPTVFLYAGFPGKKDEIIKMIRGFIYAKHQYKLSFVFIVAGPTIEDLLRLGLSFSELQEAHSFCFFIGAQPTTIVNRLYLYSDFFVLLKNPLSRRSIADFPSKIIQSLSHGVPVVANLSSDLKSVLVDHVDSLLVQDDCYESFGKTIRVACTTSNSERFLMRKNAITLVQKKFSIINYKNIFLKSISEK